MNEWGRKVQLRFLNNHPENQVKGLALTVKTYVLSCTKQTINENEFATQNQLLYTPFGGKSALRQDQGTKVGTRPEPRKVEGYGIG